VSACFLVLENGSLKKIQWAWSYFFIVPRRMNCGLEFLGVWRKMRSVLQLDFSLFDSFEKLISQMDP
jgi:hypothetical protein